MCVKYDGTLWNERELYKNTSSYDDNNKEKRQLLFKTYLDKGYKTRNLNESKLSTYTTF